jgi:two-component sensor histidine kinase
LKYFGFVNACHLANGDFVLLGSGKFYLYDANMEKFEVITNDQLEGYSIAEFENGDIIYSSKYYNGVRLFNPSTKKVNNFSYLKDEPVYGIRKDRNGDYWFACLEKLCQYKPDLDTLICFYHEENAEYSHPESSLIEMEFDKHNNLWFMTSGKGAGNVSLSNNLFSNISDEIVNNIQVIPDDKLLLNINWKGFKIISRDGKKTKTDYYHEMTNTRIGYGAILLDNEDFWFVENSAKLIRKNKRGEKVFSNYKLVQFNNLISDSNNRIWTTYGLKYYEALTDQMVHPNDLLVLKNSRDSLPSVKGRTLAALKDGSLVMGTSNNGFFHYNPVDTSLAVYSNQNFDIGRFSSSAAGNIYESPSSGLVYIATNENINVWNRTNNSFQYLGQDIIKGRTVSMIEDDKGFLWVHSATGIHKLKNDTLVASFGSNFDLDNDVDLCYNVMVKDQNGNIFFNNSKGVYKFNPNDFENLPKPSKVLIDGIFLKRVLLDPKTNSTLLKKNILFKPKLTFDYNNRDVGFRFVSINGVNSKVDYFYRLRGYNDNWTSTDGKRAVHFTNLDHGKYTFEVKAKDLNGEWTAEISAIDFTVSAPWYARWWAFLLYALTLFIGTYLIYYIRLKRLLKYQTLRTKISSDLHDDVGTLLSSVAMQSEILAIDAPDEKVERFDKLSKMSREAMGRMRDTVWAIDSRKDNMISLVDRMEDHLADSFELSNLNYEFNKTIAKDALIPPNIRQNVYLIFKEAVTNSIKYCNGTMVHIDLKQNKKSIHLSIKDNGSIDKDKIRTSGTGLSNIKMRSERIAGQLHFVYENGFGVHLKCNW